MGLDMNLKKISRKDFENISKDDFWYEHFDKSKELIYWRKEYDIDEWFRENTFIYEECSDEIPKEKLQLLINFLEQKNFIDYANQIKEIIQETNFNDEVIFYEYCN